MSQASNFLEESILNYFLRNQQVTQPAQVFLALYTTNPTDSDTGTEVYGSGYERQLVTFSPPTQAGEKAQIANATRIEFPTSTGNQGEVTHFGLHTAKTGGQLLIHGAFNKPTTINEGDKFIIDTGNLTISAS